MDKRNEEFDKGNLEECVIFLEQAWKELPDDKIIFDEWQCLTKRMKLLLKSNVGTSNYD
ncbi:hypothetical protein OR571_17125 [Psychrobacillus sp. NEAU-3TGS]|uniref:hypothetical protein n=1 Tax=Psychrobacillus sp. NEAU-3TGS TaxID=2995412 RepID=UPI002495C4B3|nr:hypothetical protein [Psychrobacillus sp. NEAU-3TGS]MDI2588775.1 hypothetical protein [Psychrobacillus sp. NEAU-3TGS]